MAIPTTPFQFPREHAFPPFYTRQPNLTTHHAQLTKWSTITLSYCAYYRLFRLSVSAAPPVPPANPTITLTLAPTIPDPSSISSSSSSVLPALFSNEVIDRRLSEEDIRKLFSHMKGLGKAEWVAGTKEGAAWIYWKTVEEWAGVVEGWVEETGQRGQVLTVYELLEGEKSRGTEFWGMDEEVLRKALGVLVKKGKAQIFGQDASGVKFF